ncbi:methylated-DNA--[protein]-cysteine S-methyltransferase [Streptomyces sp. NBC_00503]|uniref:methylated-DNA--[protein]-cysteine S-methyltransferase n=1 Tax=Streptomyces sp. NBC_00503 TaxID=2903659 RepID=UPI002E8128CC|nr:methylated-DNA--[protein]-cysteine S-methyltransferase [Streptomyces sp. NBC_00503]WUD86487.1 methylated-DNA--[protein]-cysteine S-methyltransferase [Streptomyces sp. NBC_00503]
MPSTARASAAAPESVGAASPGVARTSHATAIGELRLAATDHALVYCGFQDPDTVDLRIARAGLTRTPQARWTPRQSELLADARTQIDEYLAGTRRSFTLPVDLVLATPFSRQTVLALDAFVPYGRTATYAELAGALSRPRAARAVGTALGANPLCVVLPCHRIVASAGGLAGYAGGVEAKKYLLDLEESA